MYRGYKVVACIPAGRERVMSLNLMNLRAQRGILDGVMLWMNTQNDADRKYIYAQKDGFVTVVQMDLHNEPFRKPLQLNTGRFYPYCIAEDTIYIRFDDDIVWQHEDAIKNLVDCRIDNPEYFLIFSTIWNNAFISAIEQELGRLDNRFGKIHRYCMDDIAWKHPEFGVYVHNVLLQHIENGTVPELYFDLVPLPNFERFSISSFAWFGKDFAKFGGVLDRKDEEIWLTEIYPRRSGRISAICGNAIVAHYSFFTQRPSLDKTDILKRYRDLSERKLHDRYYDLIAIDDANPKPFAVSPWWEK